MVNFIRRKVAYLMYYFASTLNDLGRSVDVRSDNKTGKQTYRQHLQEFIAEKLSDRSGSLLDLGAGGWGYLSEEYSEAFELTSFDISDGDYIDVVGDIYEIENYFEENSFDVVVCTDVLEHVVNPITAIEKILYVLRPGGLLIASTPFNKELHGEEYGDYWRITRQGWRWLLDGKFTKIDIDRHGNERHPKAYLVSAIKKFE